MMEDGCCNLIGVVVELVAVLLIGEEGEAVMVWKEVNQQETKEKLNSFPDTKNRERRRTCPEVLR